MGSLHVLGDQDNRILRGNVLNFLHRQLHKAIPPRTPSPYRYGPFAKAFRNILTEYASKAKVAVEFGVLHGYSTSIIAKAMPAGGTLFSYDLFDKVSIGQVMENIGRYDVEVCLEAKSIWDWKPFPFDFMWIDVAATPLQMWLLHEKFQPYLKDSVVLSEGTHRTGDKRIYSVPSEDLCTIPPGIFRFLP